MEGYRRTRAEALAAGDISYHTGKPCKYKHIAPRFASNGTCSECSRLHAARKYYEEDGSPEANPNNFR